MFLTFPTFSTTAADSCFPSTESSICFAERSAVAPADSGWSRPEGDPRSPQSGIPESKSSKECAVKFKFALAVLILSFTLLGHAQAPPTLQRFDAADVRIATRNSNSQSSGGFLRGALFQFRTATMLELISGAYGVDADKVLGGPNWLEWDRFTIIAKVPAATTSDSAKLMLRSLLEDRFGLSVHTEDRPVPAYILTLANGSSKLKSSDSDANSCQGVPQQIPPGGGPAYSLLTCRGFTMAAFAQLLPQTAPGYINRTVVDRTELSGRFDFELKWSGRGQLAVGGVSLFDAVDQQ